MSSFSHARTLVVMFGLLALAGTARSDSLSVETPFPPVRFHYVVNGQPSRPARLTEVIKRKSILFVFASW
jgi:hypothetical protein